MTRPASAPGGEADARCFGGYAFALPYQDAHGPGGDDDLAAGISLQPHILVLGLLGRVGLGQGLQLLTHERPLVVAGVHEAERIGSGCFLS